MRPSAKAGPCSCGCGCAALAGSFAGPMEEMIRIGAGFARRTFSGEAVSPRDMTLSGLRMLAASAEAVGALMPHSLGGDAWQELANKLHAYRLFVGVDTEF